MTEVGMVRPNMEVMCMINFSIYVPSEVGIGAILGLHNANQESLLWHAILRLRLILRKARISWDLYFE